MGNPEGIKLDLTPNNLREKDPGDMDIDEMDRMIEELEASTDQAAKTLEEAGRNPEKIREEAIEEDEEDWEEDDDGEDEEHYTPAELGETLGKSSSFKKFITARTAKVAGLVLGAAIIAGGVIAGIAGAANQAETAAQTFSAGTPPVEWVIDSGAEDTGEVNEAIGIKDGYGEDKMWCCDTKPNTVAFADFNGAIEKFDGNKQEAAKYMCDNEVEAKSDYIAGLDAMRPEAFKNLNELEINEKLESLSPEEFDQISKEFNDIMDGAKVRPATLNGKYTNAYIATKDGDNLVGSKLAMEKGLEINHDTQQLVACNTNEKDTPAWEFYWEDDNGNQIDSILVKDSCGQVVDKWDENTKRWEGLQEALDQSIKTGGPLTIITGGGPIVTPTPEPSPTPTPTPKQWGKSGNPHAGKEYTQTRVTNPAVPDISNINDGNRGYIDDMSAAPGASTEGERLSGGENQGGDNINGENIYHSEESIEQGQKQDDSGNQAQESAQEHNDTGGDNNSNRQEESRVAEGNF